MRRPAAFLLHHLISGYTRMMAEISATQGETSLLPKDGIVCSGYGICKELHGDIEYYYAVKDRKLEVYSVEWAEDLHALEHCTKLRIVDLETAPEARRAVRRAH
jgi:hypothetical protein